MTELERRALLGDRQAQEEYTRNGVVLPCPFCGNTNIRTSNWGMWRCWCPECMAKSDDCLRERDAIKQWNTRPAPPIGRCWECLYSTELNENGMLFCENLSVGMKRDDFCSDFKPKERKQ